MLATIACAMSPSMPMLLVGRTVQGLGGGLLLSMSYSAVRMVFDEQLWSRAMVLVSSMWGVATLMGPAIGGIFAQTGHWRLAFWAVLPIAGLLALLVHTQIQQQRAASTRRVQAPAGKITLLAISVLLVSLASLAQHWTWNVAGIAAGVLMTILIARADSHARIRLFPTGSYSTGTALGS
ncbi:MFS transporter, partial [Parapusillimonas granuli]